MKQTIITVLLMLGIAVAANADSAYWDSSSMTTSTANDISEAIDVSGYIDRIEIWADEAGSTGTVTVCSYNDSTVIDTYATVTVEEQTPVVVRPRLIGSASSGTALTYATTYINQALGTNFVATQVLEGDYERPMAGSIVKAYAVGTVVAATNAYHVRIFYDPTDR